MFTSFEERIRGNSIIQIIIVVLAIIIAFIPNYSSPILMTSLPVLFLVYTLSLTGIAIISGILFLNSGVKESKIFLEDPKISIKESLSMTLKNKDFLLFLGINLLITMSYYYFNTIDFYPIMFGDSDFQSSLFIIAFEYVFPLSTIFFIYMWRKQSDTRDIKSNLRIGIFFLIFSSFPLVYINSYFLFLIVILRGVGRAAVLLYNFIFLSSLIDAEEINSKKRRDGTFFGFFIMFNSLGSFLSILLNVFIMPFTSFPGYVDSQSPPDLQLFLETKLINFIMILALLIGSLVLLQIFSFNSEKIKKIEEEVENLHREKNQKMNE
jgi:Na+/melibiose symporter-like transporter